jgi:PTS system nitrogen regulatory IIA component
MADTVKPDTVLAGLRLTSKKQVLQELARRASQITGESERTILDVLLERERLGSTGVGRGIAIPHGRLPSLDRVYGVFARLDRAVDFDAVDDQPVDLVYLLLAPENAGADHLKALAKVSRLLRNESVCAKLRGCETPDAILALVAGAEAVNAA